MRILFFLAILPFTLHINAQITFNKRVHFGHPAAVMTGVIVTDSCYFATGIVADTLPPHKTGSVFSRISLEGEAVFHKVVTSPTKTYETWEDPVMTQDGGILLVGNSYDSATSCFFMKFNLSGDTVLFQDYPHPLAPWYAFMRPNGGVQLTNDGGFISCNSIHNGALSFDIYMVRADAAGAVVWDSVYKLPLLDLPRSMIPDGQGGFIIGSLTDDQQLVTQNFVSQNHIFNIDGNGEVLWSYHSPDSAGLMGTVNDLVMLDDGSLIVATGIGTEIERPTGNTIWFEKLLYKLSPDHEIEWERVFLNPGPQNSVADLNNVIGMSDGSGFIAAGIEGELGINSFTIRGFLAKVSPNGEVIWTRRYVGLDSEEPIHKVFDLHETPDGGIIMVGESHDGTGDTYPRQQAWLLKLDQYGCLVPGCNLLDDVDETTKKPIGLIIYPNPTTDYLNFQLHNVGLLQKGTFRILDANGQLLRSFPSNGSAGDTFILPIWDWAAGVYFLQYVDGEKGVVVSEKFIKL